MNHHVNFLRIYIGSMLCFIWLGLATGRLGAQEVEQKVTLIAHSDILQQVIQKKDLKDVFLGRKTVWDDQTPILFVILKKGEVHERFLKDYVGKTPSQFSNYWEKQVFTGKGKMPKQFQTEQKLMEYGAKTKGAIGYIGPTVEIKNVKKLTIKP